MSTSNASSKAALVGLLALIVLALTVCLQHQSEGYPWGGDNALHLLHTRNLATAQPYHQTAYVYDDEAWQEGTPSFPPGLPLVLTPIYAVVGLNLEALRDFCVFLLVGSLVPVFFFYRNWLSPWFALMAAAFLIFNCFLLKTIHGVGSEQLYLLVSFGCLALAAWIYSSGRNQSNPIVWGLAVGLLATYTNFTRSIGISLMAGLVLYDLYLNRRITRFIVSAGLVFIAAVGASNLLLHNDATFRTQFRLDPVLSLVNLWQYLTGSMELWMGMPGRRWPRIILWLFTTLTALWGLAVRLRRQGPGLAEFYAVSYCGVLAVYWMANPRYLTPLMPLYFLYLFEGVQNLWRQPRARLACGAMLAAMCFAEVSHVAGLGQQPLEDGVHTKTYRETLAYIQRELPASARITSDSARYLALFTSRPSLGYPWQEDPAQIAKFLKRLKVDYVLVSKHHELDQKKLIPALEMELVRPEPIFENAEYAIYRMN